MIETTQQPTEVASDRAIAGPDQPATAASQQLVIRKNPDRLNRRGRRNEEETQRRFTRRTLRSLDRQESATINA